MSASVADGAWDLTLADRPLVEARRLANRLRFAVMLLFFRARGRFPRAATEVIPDAADRTTELQRAERLALLGFREASVDDAESLGTWLRDHAVSKTRDPVELAAEAEARCRSLRIEPPTSERIARIVRAAVRSYEDKRVAVVHARLTPAMRVGLDALLKSAVSEGTAEIEDLGAQDGRSDAPLIHLRAGPGRASVASLRDELARLDAVRGLGLPDGLFADWSRAELEACRQRVAVEAPYELRRHPDATRQAWLAAYAHMRGRAVIDTLVDLLIETVHHIGARAEHEWSRTCSTASSGSAASRPCYTGSPMLPSNARTVLCARCSIPSWASRRSVNWCAKPRRPGRPTAPLYAPPSEAPIAATTAARCWICSRRSTSAPTTTRTGR